MRIVLALGGNALQSKDSGNRYEDQMKQAEETASCLADLLMAGHELIVTHGNGPQVGRILLQNEGARETTPAMPLYVCGAMSQGMIGLMLEQALRNELNKRSYEKSVATLLTQVRVDENDQAFQNPTKPIGAFCSKQEAAALVEENGYAMMNDAGRGYRRVVPSPLPKQILQKETIQALLKADHAVICTGGGGIPVIHEADRWQGIDAVIDKDFASAVLANELDADLLMILTDVAQVAINYRQPDEKWLEEVPVEEMESYLDQGHFAKGSMEPKVKACLHFVRQEGRGAIITDLRQAKDAIEGKSGTRMKK